MSDFDDQVKAKLARQFDHNTAEMLSSAYGHVNSHIGPQVLSYIRATEPNLTEHDMTHIENVKRNAVSLLPRDALTGVEMYLLGLFVLFHDAGNFFGRTGHENRVGEVFDALRPGNDGYVRHEKSLVTTATRAHTGSSKHGSKDTLQPIAEQDQHFGRRVRLRELSAILRFSDELAEGPQRTSPFAQEQGFFCKDSQIYHTYANSTSILIDREGGRIEVSYEIELEEQPDQITDTMTFFYERLIKLNQERQYATHYSELLRPFSATYATFNFHFRGRILDLDLNPLRLTDLVVPGEPSRDIEEIDPRYGVRRIVADLLARMEA